MSTSRLATEPRPAENESELRDLVRRHKVYWEIRPEPTLDPHDEVVQTGFQIGLRGTFENPDHPLTGSPECLEVFRDLRKIAEGILPPEGEEANYKIGLFENAIDYTPASGRKDIEVMITIESWESRHHVDDGEIASMRHMKARLKDLGAPEGRWRSRPGPRGG